MSTCSHFHRFDTSNTQQLYENLSMEEKQVFGFSINDIDWETYIKKIHIPGLRKHVLKGCASKLWPNLKKVWCLLALCACYCHQLIHFYIMFFYISSNSYLQTMSMYVVVWNLQNMPNINTSVFHQFQVAFTYQWKQCCEWFVNKKTMNHILFRLDFLSLKLGIGNNSIWAKTTPENCGIMVFISLRLFGLRLKKS